MSFKKGFTSATLLAATMASGLAQANSTEELVQRLDQLAAENQRLQQRVEQLEQAKAAAPEPVAPVAAPAAQSATVPEAAYIGLNHAYAYDVLDPTTRINSKQEMILERLRDGSLGETPVQIGGAITAIMNTQRSNTGSKFGYLMRHPTPANQRTKSASEAVIHSAQVEVTASAGDWTNVYLEYLYDPEQSFGAGTITALSRNQIQLRQGYVLFGNLAKSPFYASLGKMSTPFGLTDTLNPFTGSTVWHAFGGLAYGVKGGYMNNGWNVRLMGIQGGAQFRSHNVPVDNSNVPSKLNNYAADVNYTAELGADDYLMMGASYTKGTAYCQNFPVTHFSSCDYSNSAYDVYARMMIGQWEFQAEFAKTNDIWKGTFNPTLPQFEAAKVTSWDLGTRYRSNIKGMRVDWSADFSRFVAGPNGAPWERQNQIVLGVAAFTTESSKLFLELIHTDGYAPLNFISGGNIGPGATVSEADAKSNILMVGANVAF